MLETQYRPDVVSTGTADPNMSHLGNDWLSGGLGRMGRRRPVRIAVIDTGIDTDPNCSPALGFQYALEMPGGAGGKTLEDYQKELDLLDAERIAAVLDQLNIGSTVAAKNYTAEDLYVSGETALWF